MSNTMYTIQELMSSVHTNAFLKKGLPAQLACCDQLKKQSCPCFRPGIWISNLVVEGNILWFLSELLMPEEPHSERVSVQYKRIHITISEENMTQLLAFRIQKLTAFSSSSELFPLSPISSYTNVRLILSSTDIFSPTSTNNPVKTNSVA